MKKSNFITMILGTVSGMLFALGMCMVLLPEWNSVKPGIVLGSVGVVLGIFTVILWRGLTGKAPIKFSAKGFFTVVLAIVGSLALGIGMCFCMVWDKMVLSIVIGMVGIVILLCLIPLIKGIHD